MRYLLPLLLCCSSLLHAQLPARALDSLLEAHRAALSGRGGGATLLLARDGQMLYSHSVGSFTADKPVPIASASKWYAGVLLMTLVHDGTLSLDDKVSKYLPSFNRPDKKDITLRQCFALTAGFAGGSEELDEFMKYRREGFAAMVDRIAEEPLAAAPGAQLNYGGIGMQVVGRMCEVASGKGWHQLFEERVIRPLGLRHTYYGGYRIGAAPRVAGGVTSSASDYLKLLRMLAAGGRIGDTVLLSPVEVRELLADQTGGAAIGYSPFTKYKTLFGTDRDPRYGIGNWIIREPSFTINTSPGAFGFTPWIDLGRGYYGVLAVQSAGPRVMPVFRKILAEIDGGLGRREK
ncbi:serine hydrolase domain-containing protein [Flaviaesturariibacter amylovorans]|uniref:Beta-lactamase-related domain-containing protein n=1 Tax=Flaviaesturariibacter amylovorans TaxID=1084520 RepID=A0ABP8HMY4_9BACT